MSFIENIFIARQTNMNPDKKSLGVRLISSLNWVLLIFQYLLFPVGVLVLLFTNRPNPDFASRLIYAFGIVYVAGGFFVLSTKFWEIWDDGFISMMKKKWRMGPIMRRIFYKIVIPKDFSRVPGDMGKLYYDLWNLNSGPRTKYEVYTEGAWYYDFVIDFIIRGGKVEMYMSFVYKRKDLVLESFKNRFPELKIIECEDPFKNWPKNWKKGVGVPGYRNFEGANYGFGAPDIYPLAEPEWYSDPPTWPLGELLNSLKDYDPAATVALQYVLSPYDTIHYDRWIKELEKIKSDYLEKSTGFNVSMNGESSMATTGELVSDRQKTRINRIENRINDNMYKMNIKLLIFYPEGKEFYVPVMEKFMKTYCGATAGSQILVKVEDFSTDRGFVETQFQLWDGIIGPIMDNLYHRKEVEYRKQALYEALLSREGDVSHPSSKFMVDVPHLPSILHFPGNVGIFEELETKKEVEDQMNKQAQNTPNSFEKLQQLRQKATTKAVESLNVDKL